jgi:hypothetical protein
MYCNIEWIKRSVNGSKGFKNWTGLKNRWGPVYRKPWKPVGFQFKTQNPNFTDKNWLTGWFDRLADWFSAGLPLIFFGFTVFKIWIFLIAAGRFLLNRTRFSGFHENWLVSNGFWIHDGSTKISWEHNHVIQSMFLRRRPGDAKASRRWDFLSVGLA